MSQRLANTLAQRAGKNPDADHVSQAMVAICQEIFAALEPILGQQGVIALYQRSLQRAALTYPWLAPTDKSMQAGLPNLDLATLKPLFSHQTAAVASAGGTAFLLSFSELLSSLIGLSLTEQLLQPVWKTQLNSAPAQNTPP